MFPATAYRNHGQAIRGALPELRMLDLYICYRLIDPLL